MRTRNLIFLILSIAILSFGLAMIFIRVSSLWPLMPDLLSVFVSQFFNIETQEQAANIEFFTAWVFCFLILIFVAFAILIITFFWGSKRRVG